MSSGLDTSQDRSWEGEGTSRKESVRQTSVKMAVMTGGKKTEDDDCLCYTGVHKIEKTIKCDLIIKYK